MNPHASVHSQLRQSPPSLSRLPVRSAFEDAVVRIPRGHRVECGLQFFPARRSRRATHWQDPTDALPRSHSGYRTTARPDTACKRPSKANRTRRNSGSLTPRTLVVMDKDRLPGRVGFALQSSQKAASIDRAIGRQFRLSRFDDGGRKSLNSIRSLQTLPPEISPFHHANIGTCTPASRAVLCRRSRFGHPSATPVLEKFHCRP